jgi:hypothetical protein
MQKGPKHITESWEDRTGPRHTRHGLNCKLRGSGRRRIRYETFHRWPENSSYLPDLIYKINLIDLISERITRNPPSRILHALIGSHKRKPIIQRREFGLIRVETLLPPKMPIACFGQLGRKIFRFERPWFGQLF